MAVLDASAVLALLGAETGARSFRSHRRRTSMSTVNLAEIEDGGRQG